MEYNQNRLSGTLKVNSVNINGLQDKLLKVRDFFEMNKLDILLIQETHNFQQSDAQALFEDHNLLLYINKEMTHPFPHGHLYNGTAVLFNKSLLEDFEVKHEILQRNRIQKVTLVKKNEGIDCDDNRDLVLYNVYFKSGNSKFVRKQRSFSMDILNKNLERLYDKRIILGGDFNFVTCNLDTLRSFHPNREESAKWESITQKYNLNDGFRKKHRSKRFYTRVTRKSATRIDRIYSTEHLINYSHISLPFSDHCSSPSITVDVSRTSMWGKGIWKLNSTLIQEESKLIKIEIEKFKYKEDLFEDKLQWWESLKRRLKKIYISAGITKAKNRKDTIQEKEDLINKQISSLTIDQLEDLNTYNKLKQDMIEIERLKQKSHSVNLKIKEIKREEEKPNKDFFKMNYKEKQRSCIKVLKDDGVEYKDKDDILNIIYNFYSKLWSEDPECDGELLGQRQDMYLDSIKCDFDNDEDSLISPIISTEEIETATNSAKHGTSPGSDGRTYEFYQAHLDDIVEDLQGLYMNCYMKNTLPKSMRESIVKLVPKKGDLRDIQNWRPISLLNCDYKILSKVIYNKIIGFLNDKIHSAQKGGLPGRNILGVHYNIKSALEFVKDRRLKQLAIMKIDWEKAFDNVNYSFMYKILKKYKIPNSIIKWIKILYTNTTSKIMVNGVCTKEIQITKGLRQGCPLSMLIFALIMDPLVRKVEANDNISGIVAGLIHLKLQLCADDVTLFLTSNADICAALKTLKEFMSVSKQKMNYKKFKILCHGYDIKHRIMQTSLAENCKSKIKLLGISYSFTEKTTENWIKPIKQMEKIIQIQKFRNLTMYGKIHVMNTLIVPLIFQKLHVLDVDDKFIKQIDNLLFNFMWHPEKELVSREDMVANKCDGGLNMIDIFAKRDAALVNKLKIIANSNYGEEFWIDWALYNVGIQIKDINKNIFTNTKPHSGDPTKYWKDICKVYRSVKESVLDWKVVTYKTLYMLFKMNREGKPSKDHCWDAIHLLKSRKLKYLCTNKEREISFLIAHDAYRFGHWKKMNLPFQGVQVHLNYRCKFCKSSNDNLDHIFTECMVIKRILLLSKHYYYFVTKKKMEFDRDLLLFNDLKLEADTLLTNYDIQKLKLAAVIKKFVIIEKLKLDNNNEFVLDRGEFISDLMSKIKCAFSSHIA